MQCQKYWIFRYSCVGISCFFTLFTITVITIERLYRYLSCKLFLLMNISFLIVTINALLWTDKFTGGSCTTVSDYVEQPYKGLCEFEAWAIHSFWLIGFSLSVLLNLAILKALQGNAEFLLKWEKRLILICFIAPMVLMCIPFTYSGYGPSGFNLVYPNNRTQFVYLFCGWKNDGQWLPSFLNNSLPTIILCLLSATMTIRIYMRKRRLQRQQVQFTNKQKLIIRTAFIPLFMTLFWTANVLFRAFIPSDTNEDGKDPDPNASMGGQWVLVVVNTTFDLLPAFQCMMFLLYISCSVPLKRFHFLSCKSVRQQSLLTSSDGDSQDYNN